MSRPPGPNKPTTVRSTQQQLAELDALLERMLALPVHQLDERDLNAGKPVTTPRLPLDPEPVPVLEEEPAVPEPAQVLTFVPISSGAQEESPQSGVAFVEIPEAHEPPSALRQSVEDWQFPAPAATVFPSAPPDPARDDFREMIPPEPWSRASGPTVMESPPPSATPGILAPLVWSNRVCDACLSCLGSPGRWLQGPHGKTCLGVIGLLLLAGAVAWGILDWMGWSW